MWKIDTHWIDIALVMSLCVVGHILLGHFEDYKPKTSVQPQAYRLRVR